MNDAADWYGTQQAGLDRQFLSAIDKCLEFIQLHPRAFPIIYKEYRRALLMRFPYALIYWIDVREDEDTIVVASCYHTHRDPTAWQQRLN